MSECVVRMEMPSDCTCCPMCFTADVQGYHWCAALEQEVEQGLNRPKECPIICQLPRRAWAAGCDAPYWCRWMSEIEDAPTIVPAEAQRKVDAPDAVTPTDTPTNTPTVTAERSET